MRTKTTSTTAKQDRAAFVTQTHPLYDEWIEMWTLAGENYEGDGGYLDGTNLIAHPRELNFKQLAGGGYDFTQIDGIKEKLKRRRALARYDNFAQALTDIFVDHQYAKAIGRTFTDPKKPNDDYLAWLENVDGEGTHLDDWLKERQVLAHTYGHVSVLMDRTPGVTAKPRSRAEQGPLVLRDYIPTDTLDWLAPRKNLTAIKFVEAIERTSLTQPSLFSTTYRGTATGENRLAAKNLEYLFYDAAGWKVYDTEGAITRTGTHGFEELPAAMFYSRKRARIPVLGRPLLRDPKLFRDHYNLVSELRELLRSQVFSMLHIQLGPDETVETARARLGDHAGTDTVVFTVGGADFIAPADGPVATLATQIETCERKMFRLVNLPWEGDSHDSETAESRRLKAMDLNRTLAGHADEAERFEYRIARLFYIGTYGREAGLAKWQENPPVIRHPDEFHTEQVIAAVEDVKAAIGLQLGKTAEMLLRKRVVPIVLPDLDKETVKIIEDEIETTPYSPAAAAGDFAAALADNGVATDNADQQAA